MTIIGRYVFRQSAGGLMLILSSLSGVVWIALALRQLNVVTSQGQDALTLIKMTTLALPNLMALIAPVALLIAAIHTLNRLNGDSELIVLTAAGATIWTPAKPILVLAVLVSMAVSAVNHVAMPWSLRQLREYIIQVRTDLLTQVIQPGRFSSPEAGLTFHIRERALNGDLLGVLMHDTRDAKQSLSYLAEKAVIVKQGASAFLVMSGGHVLRRSSMDEPAQILAFERYAIDILRFEQKEIDVDLKPKERYYSELVSPEEKSENFKRLPGQFRAELHERFSSALYPLAFAFLALAFVGQAQSTRQNRAGRMVAGFALAAAARLGGMATTNLVVMKPWAVVLMYAIPLGVIVLCLVLMRQNAMPKGGATVGDRVIEAIQDRLSRVVGSLTRRARPAGGQT